MKQKERGRKKCAMEGIKRGWGRWKNQNGQGTIELQRCLGESNACEINSKS